MGYLRKQTPPFLEMFKQREREIIHWRLQLRYKDCTKWPLRVLSNSKTVLSSSLLWSSILTGVLREVLELFLYYQ